MKRTVDILLDEIYASGREHDSKDSNHSTRMLNITPDTGRFLSILIQSCGAKNILEVGTSNGYSTLWLADAASRTGGKVTTTEISEKKYEIATGNFSRSGLVDYIDAKLVDIRNYIINVKTDSVDLLFLDAERTQYQEYWTDLDRVLGQNSLLVVDNAIAPKPEEMTWLTGAIASSGRYESQIVNIGNGELLALKLY